MILKHFRKIPSFRVISMRYIQTNLNSDNVQSTSKKTWSRNLGKDHRNVFYIDHLDKHITNLSSNRTSKYEADIIFLQKKINKLISESSNHGLFLINCCTQLLADDISVSSLNLLKNIWKTIKCSGEITIDHFNEVLKVYIEKNMKFDICPFMKQMASLQPNADSFALLTLAFGEWSNIVDKLAQELKSSSAYEESLKIATEVTLQIGKAQLAINLLARLKSLCLPLRANYFWPILVSVSTHENKGEEIMKVLVTMISLGVEPDHETMEKYVLCHEADIRPDKCMKKYLQVGLRESTVLNSLIVVLLNRGQMNEAAARLCEFYAGSLDIEHILCPLLNDYLTGGDLKRTVNVLSVASAAATSDHRDWVGRFLCLFVYLENFTSFLGEFRSLIKELERTELKITSEAARQCLSMLPERFKKKTGGVVESLANITSVELTDAIDVFVNQMPHPGQITKISLAERLNMLELSGSRTGSVLNKILKRAVRLGNLDDVEAIIAKCRRHEISITPTTKADLFYMYVKRGELDRADKVSTDLEESASNFTLSQFMIIEYATRLVYRKQVDKAIDYLKRHSRHRCLIGHTEISGSCGKLLAAAAEAGSPQDLCELFLIITTDYRCPVSKVLLGPLISVHLKSNNIEEAVEEFVRITEEHKLAPQKKALLCALLTNQKSARNPSMVARSKNLVKAVLNATENLEGPEMVKSTLIAALADVGDTVELSRIFRDHRQEFDPRALMWYCERFVQDKKTHALKNIAECARDHPLVVVERINSMLTTLGTPSKRR